MEKEFQVSHCNVETLFRQEIMYFIQCKFIQDTNYHILSESAHLYWRLDKKKHSGFMNRLPLKKICQAMLYMPSSAN